MAPPEALIGGVRVHGGITVQMMVSVTASPLNRVTLHDCTVSSYLEQRDKGGVGRGKGSNSTTTSSLYCRLAVQTEIALSIHVQSCQDGFRLFWPR